MPPQIALSIVCATAVETSAYSSSSALVQLLEIARHLVFFSSQNQRGAYFSDYKGALMYSIRVRNKR